MLSCTLGLPQLQPRAARNICLPLPQETLAEPRAPLSLACPCALWFTICRPIIALVFICARLLAVFVGGPLPSASLSVQWFQIAGLGSIFHNLCRNFYLSTSGSRRLSPDLASYRQSRELLPAVARSRELSPTVARSHLSLWRARRDPQLLFCLRSP